MDHSRRELLVARVCAGVIELGPDLFLHPPTRPQKYHAQRLHRDKLAEALADDLFDDTSLVAWLLATAQWSEGQEARLTSLPTEIEDLKVELFRAGFDDVAQKEIRKNLTEKRIEYGVLSTARHAYHHLSAGGFASLARARYLVGVGLRDSGEELLFGRGAWESNDERLDRAVVALDREKLGEAELRELARTEPWQTIWAAREAAGSVFGIPAADLSDEQRQLVYWSNFFDNVRKHPACPSEAVLADDDATDGFLINLRREANQEGERRQLEAQLPESARNAQAVFIPARSLDHAKKIESLNSPQAAAVKKARLDKLLASGVVSEHEMPDTIRKANEARAQAMRGH